MSIEQLPDYKAPENASELIRALGCDPNEGVQIALFPEAVTNVEMAGEPFRYDPDTEAYGIVGDLGPWGKRLLDLVTDPPTPVKWWKVVDLGRERGLDMVPIRWYGAISDIPDRYFQPGTILGIRFYNEGPWFWPLEKPQIQSTEEKEMLDVLKG